MFKRLNALIASRIQQRGAAALVEGVEASAEGFRVVSRAERAGTPQTLCPWGDVRAVVAVQLPNSVGSDECLLVDRGQDVLQITPDTPGYADFLAAGERQLAGWASADVWRLRLLSLEPGEGLDIYRPGEAQR